MQIFRMISLVVCGLVLLSGGACTSDVPTSAPSAVVSSPGQGAVVDVAALINSGITAVEKERFVEAKVNFEQALEVDPRNKFAWFNLGFLAQTRSDAAEAVRNYDEALKIDPVYTPAMFNKAILLETSDPNAAIALYQKILGINEKAATTLIRLGVLLDEQGDEAAAQDAFTRAVKLDAALAEAVPQSYRSRSGVSTGSDN